MSNQTGHQIILSQLNQWKHTAFGGYVYPPSSSLWLSMPHPQMAVTHGPPGKPSHQAGPGSESGKACQDHSGTWHCIGYGIVVQCTHEPVPICLLPRHLKSVGVTQSFRKLSSDLLA